jgi:hypothetical protein
MAIPPFKGFKQPRENQFDAVGMGLLIQAPRYEFRSVANGEWLSADRGGGRPLGSLRPKEAAKMADTSLRLEVHEKTAWMRGLLEK